MAQSNDKKFNAFGLTGLILGVISVFLYQVGVLPILGLVFSGIGLAKFDKERHKHKWMAFVGLGLSAIYCLMYLVSYGHINF